MLAGISIIASGVEGLTEVVGDAGRLVPPERPDFLASAILELAADPETRSAVADRARERSVRLFHRDRMVAQTAAVYESVLAGPPPPPRRGATKEPLAEKTR